MPAAEKQDHASRATTTPSESLFAAPSPGQICYVYESMTTPVELIFLETPPIQANPDHVRQCQEALDRIHAEGSEIGKVRPCIVMSLAADGVRSPTICLKGTFGGADPATLNEVYQHFIRGIYPNLGLPGSPHLHLVPEEQKKNCWVVAFEFESFRPISETWEAALSNAPQASVPKRKTSRSRSQVIRNLEKVSRGILRDECQTSLQEWQAGCVLHPERAVKCFEKHRAKSNFASQTTLNSSTYSRSLYAPSTMTLSMDTLHEEGVADGNSNATPAYLPQDSCGICATRKLKAPKTRKKSPRFSIRSAKSFSKVHDLKTAI